MQSTEGVRNLAHAAETMRARNLKPGFFKNEDLARLDPLARILFEGLWCMADREGRLEDRPPRIKAEVLPYDNCDIDGLLTQLHTARFIIRYHNGGKTFIAIPTFKAHQNPHVREATSVIPSPSGDAKSVNGYEQEVDKNEVATAADKSPDKHQKSTVPRTALAMPGPASSLNPPSGIQQQQNNRDLENGAGAVTQPAAGAARNSGETQESRPDVARALDAAGIGNPARREFLANPYCTAGLVTRLESDRRRDGKRIGALVENIRAALRRDAGKAEAQANRERNSSQPPNLSQHVGNGMVSTMTGAAAAYVNQPVERVSVEERKRILAPGRALLQVSSGRAAGPPKRETPPTPPPLTVPTAAQVEEANVRRAQMRKQAALGTREGAA